MVTGTSPSLCNNSKGSVLMAMMLKCGLPLANEPAGEISQEAEGQDFGGDSLASPFLLGCDCIWQLDWSDTAGEEEGHQWKPSPEAQAGVCG